MMQIPLKKKYRSAMKGRYSGGERPAPKKNRRKVTNDALRKAIQATQPIVVLHVDGLTGKGVYRHTAKS